MVLTPVSVSLVRASAAVHRLVVRPGHGLQLEPVPVHQQVVGGDLPGVGHREDHPRHRARGSDFRIPGVCEEHLWDVHRVGGDGDVQLGSGEVQGGGEGQPEGGAGAGGTFAGKQADDVTPPKLCVRCRESGWRGRAEQVIACCVNRSRAVLPSPPSGVSGGDHSDRRRAEPVLVQGSLL